MIQDRVYGYYIGQNKSCAESIFLAANDEYQLGAGPECLKMIGAFSGGACCGSFCGAVAGGCAAIALRTGPVDLDAHSNPEMREKIKAFVQAFQAGRRQRAVPGCEGKVLCRRGALPAHRGAGRPDLGTIYGITTGNAINFTIAEKRGKPL